MTIFRFICILCMAIFGAAVAPHAATFAKAAPVTEKILFIPHDGRPISSKQTADVVKKLGYDVVMPPSCTSAPSISIISINRCPQNTLCPSVDSASTA